MPGREDRQYPEGGDRVKIWQLRNDIYHITTYLMLEKNKDVARAYLKNKLKITKEEADDMIGGDSCCSWIRHVASEKKVYWIWVPVFHGSVDEVCILGHEVIHLVNNHFSDAGVEPGINYESFAYYFDYILE